MCHFVITHYVNLGLIKFPDIVKLYTYQLFYDHRMNKKSSNLNLSPVSEQHNYATRSASLKHINPESFRINISKFCATILGCYYWNDIPSSICNKPTKKLLQNEALYHNFLFCLVLIIPTLYIYLLCVYPFLSSLLFILK